MPEASCCEVAQLYLVWLTVFERLVAGELGIRATEVAQ